MRILCLSIVYPSWITEDIASQHEVIETALGDFFFLIVEPYFSIYFLVDIDISWELLAKSYCFFRRDHMMFPFCKSRALTYILFLQYLKMFKWFLDHIELLRPHSVKISSYFWLYFTKFDTNAFVRRPFRHRKVKKYWLYTCSVLRLMCFPFTSSSSSSAVRCDVKWSGYIYRIENSSPIKYWLLYVCIQQNIIIIIDIVVRKGVYSSSYT